mgnify:CR=1 FL=1
MTQDKPRLVPINKHTNMTNQKTQKTIHNRYSKTQTTQELKHFDHNSSWTNTQHNSSNNYPTNNIDAVKIISLGGLGEVGRNMHLIEYKNQGIIIDLGLRFPEENMYGIDFIIPNIEYITNNKNLKILGIIITHAHYDHLGAIPYLIDKLNYPPIYATPLSRDIILKRQEDFSYLKKLDLITIDKDNPKTIHLGPFNIDAFHVNHNVPDTIGLFIETPMGNIIYSSDYKIDFNPVADKPADLSAIVKLASRGVDLFMVDSTGVESEGHSMSEKEIYKNMETIFEEANGGRIILATFASLIGRLQQAIWLSEKYNRKVAIIGFTMKSNIAIAKKLKYIDYDPKTIIDIKNIKQYDDNKITILCTGAQGEDNAALMRIINREDKNIRIQKHDTVVFSSSVVPGNELAVQNLKDNLSKQGAKLYHYKMLDIHASGHAYKEDIKLMLNLVKPKYVMPIHGYYYMQKLMADLAQETLGIPSEQTIVASSGQVINLIDKVTTLTNKFVPANYVMVDGLGVGDVGEIVLRDRETLAKDGMFIITAILDSKTKEIRNIEIVSRGFVFMKDAGEMIRNTRNKAETLIKQAVANMMPGTINEAYIRNILRDEIGLFLFQRTQRRPMIIPILIEI